MSRTGARTVRPVSPARPGQKQGETLREIPLPPYVTVEDAQFAVRAVVVHAPRRWSGGTICRNDASPHPCRLHRWGRRVLALHGLRTAEIDALIERGDPAALPPAPERPGA
ncbi:hypothetical protein ACFY2R_01490 [Micromonospora olivasterospora]|uniref:Uncharacterized protein n=1 Tax=Micromonospora olivasterospora TaxID=1880 RepID=A0A562ICD5_MICOL|nr:hypothetical protein [Micromonospora olivasterospora]TWH68650.1 hypothetical protein JD77_03647 [Micromonospora olivasterospora]